jgi:hypothetical protein
MDGLIYTGEDMQVAEAFMQVNGFDQFHQIFPPALIFLLRFL